MRILAYTAICDLCGWESITYYEPWEANAAAARHPRESTHLLNALERSRATPMNDNG